MNALTGPIAKHCLANCSRLSKANSASFCRMLNPIPNSHIVGFTEIPVAPVNVMYARGNIGAVDVNCCER